MLTVLDLFSGIGGFSLGLERTGGFKTVAFCEIESFPRKVLAKHWPEVPCYHDIRELTAARLAADGIGVDVICGGFPCTDISVAGRGAGIKGKSSGLWSEFARLIGEIRPRYAIIENVSALLSRGLADVLGDLAEIGFNAEWHCIPASAVGAPHRRDRVWIIAHPISGELRYESGWGNGASWAGEAIAADDGKQGPVANANGGRFAGIGFSQHAEQQGASRHQSNGCGEGRWRNGEIPNSDEPGLERWLRKELRECSGERLVGEVCSHPASFGWLVEPDICRVVNGLPSKLDGGVSEEKHNTEASEESDSACDRLRDVRDDGEAGEASSRLLQARPGPSSLSAMPHQGGPNERYETQEGNAGMCSLRDHVPADAQQEAHAMRFRMPEYSWPHERDEALGIWEREPEVPRVAVGVKDRVHRLKGLGNAVVPQIPELIGRAILASMGEP